jgi:hypothetical protein
MTKAMRTTLRAALAALPFLAAELVPAVPAWAQSEEDEGKAAESEPAEAQPAESESAEAPEAAPAETPFEVPTPAPAKLATPPAPPAPIFAPLIASPPPLPGNVPPHVAYPYPRPRKPVAEAEESEGPATSWEPFRFAVAVEGRGTWLFDKGAKRLTGARTTAAPGLSVQGDVFRAMDRVALRLDLGWVTDSHAQYQYDQHGSQSQEKLERNLFWLGVSARYHVVKWLAPYVRLSGGIGWEKLTVAGMNDRQRFEHGAAGLGIFLRSPGIRPTSSSSVPFLGFVGQIEAGYAVAPGSDFVLSTSPASGNSAPIPTSSVAIGHAGRSAPYLRACLGLAF